MPNATERQVAAAGHFRTQAIAPLSSQSSVQVAVGDNTVNSRTLPEGFVQKPTFDTGFNPVSARLFTSAGSIIAWAPSQKYDESALSLDWDMEERTQNSFLDPSGNEGGSGQPNLTRWHVSNLAPLNMALVENYLETKRRRWQEQEIFDTDPESPPSSPPREDTGFHAVDDMDSEQEPDSEPESRYWDDMLTVWLQNLEFPVGGPTTMPPTPVLHFVPLPVVSPPNHETDFEYDELEIAPDSSARSDVTILDFPEQPLEGGVGDLTPLEDLFGFWDGPPPEGAK